MSIICSSCYDAIRQPVAVYFAATRYSWNIQYICSKCVDLIPEEFRHPTNDLEEFKITIGVIYASVNDRGIYQSLSAIQGPALFWVEADVLNNYLPPVQQVVAGLYPYYCFDEWFKKIQNYFNQGIFNDYNERLKIYRTLIVLGYAIEKFMGIQNNEFEICTPYSVPLAEELPQDKIQLAEKLFKKILEWK